MALLKLITKSHIEALEKVEHEKLNNLLDSQSDAKSKSWKIKDRWLAVFARSLSPTVACKQADVPLSTYRRWRNTDPRFCKAMNLIITEAHDELIGTAYARATGYLQADSETDSGYQEDATGRPIRHGVSDRLAISLVNAEKKAQELSSPVNITLNFAALGVTPENCRIESQTGSELGGEVVENPVEQDRSIDADE